MPLSKPVVALNVAQLGRLTMLNVSGLPSGSIGRTPGWCAQWEEGLLDPEQAITRPRQLYDGEPERSFLPIEDRG